MGIRINEHKDCESSGGFTVRADHGWLTVMYDDDVIRRGIGPRFHRAEALEIARIVARLLRELEEKGELPKFALSEDKGASKLKPGWERG